MAGRKKSTVIKFMETSSMKGLPRIVRAANPVLRMVWLLGFLFGMAMAIYYLYALLAVYFSHTSVTSISEGHSNVSFPDVTVCNLNPISNLEDGEIRYAEHVKNIGFLQQKHEGDEHLTDMLAYLMTPQGFLQNIEDNKLHSEVSSNFSVTCDWWFTERAHNDEVGRNCSATITHRFLSATAGHCLTFHAPRHVNGLTAIFFLDDFAYISLPDFDVSSQQVFGGGGSVVLHEPGTLPDLEGSMAVPSGYHSEFDLYTSTRIRLGRPYSQCERPLDVDWPEEIMVEPNVRYSYYTCIQLCKQHTTTQHCGCLAPGLLSTKYMRQEYEFCGKIPMQPGPDGQMTYDEERLQEMTKKYQCYIDTDTTRPICQCPTPCKENYYHFKYVQAKWPHPSFALPFYLKYIKKKPYASKFKSYDEIQKTMEKNKSAAFDMLWKEEKMQQNFFHLKVYFGTQRLDVTYEDQPAIGSETLWGNLGGTLNLWMGVSFVTLIELVELIYHLVLSYRPDNDNNGVDRNDSYHSSRSRNTSDSGERSKRESRNGTSTSAR